MEFLRRLGKRIRARRIHLNRSAAMVARSVEISTTQLFAYEAGQGHPPAGTLHRIAHSLGTTTSQLLGETMYDTSNEQFDDLVRLYNDPFIGPVTRLMQDMTAQERKTVHVITAALAHQKKPPETVKVMK